MPTRRTYSLLLIALLLYLAANQTQVAWLYLLAALIVAVILAAWVVGRGLPAGLRAERSLVSASGDDAVASGHAAELHEGEQLEVLVTLHNTGQHTAVHLLACERAPVAPLDSPWRDARVFVERIEGGTAQSFSYALVADRRGLHPWPDLQIETRAPFGMFAHRRVLPAPARVLVYPEVRPLERLDLLDRRPNPAFVQQRAGIGAEVIGVRPYRMGDSPRHIHWRSVARTRRLVSKEFADDTDTNLTLAIDLFAHPFPAQQQKQSPFEWAIKAAASIGEYARRRGYRVQLLADESVWPVPGGALEWYAFMHYLARIQPTGVRSLADVLRTSAPTCLAVVLPWPDTALLPVLTALHLCGTDMLAVMCDPVAFPGGGPDAEPLAAELQALGVATWIVRPDGMQALVS